MNTKHSGKKIDHYSRLPRASQKTLAAAVRHGMWKWIHEWSLGLRVMLDREMILCCIKRFPFFRDEVVMYHDLYDFDVTPTG